MYLPVMPSNITNGRREIEAAKKRLALAKKWTTSASAAVESAQVQLRTARDEEREAESFLKSAEERWEVVDIDKFGGPESRSHKKQRTVSLPPQPNTTLAAQNRTQAIPTATPSAIVVEGSGIFEINGTWSRCDPSTCITPSYCDTSKPLFRKTTTWNGEDVDFLMFHSIDKRSYNWFIYQEKDMMVREKDMIPYRVKALENQLLPPMLGWQVVGKRYGPAPTLNW